MLLWILVYRLFWIGFRRIRIVWMIILDCGELLVRLFR
jgi:hypothetical protein